MAISLAFIFMRTLYNAYYRGERRPSLMRHIIDEAESLSARCAKRRRRRRLAAFHDYTTAHMRSSEKSYTAIAAFNDRHAMRARYGAMTARASRALRLIIAANSARHATTTY